MRKRRETCGVCGRETPHTLDNEKTFHAVTLLAHMTPEDRDKVRDIVARGLGDTLEDGVADAIQTWVG